MRLYYGWRIVFAGMLVTGFASAASSLKFVDFTSGAIGGFGGSSTLGAASLIVIGILIDRLGPRRVMIGGAAVAILGLVMLSATRSASAVYLANVMLAVGFVAIAPLALQTAVVRWFQRRRSFALGVLMGLSFLGGIATAPAIWLAVGVDWRAGTIVLALLTLIVVGLAVLVVRDKPDEQLADLPGFTLRQALRTRTFWWLALAITLAWAPVLAFLYQYLHGYGFALSEVALAPLMIGVVGILGILGFGYLGDHLSKRRLLAMLIILQAAVYMSMALLPVPGLVVLFLMVPLLGLVAGSIPLTLGLIADHFGTARFASVAGALLGSAGLATAVFHLVGSRFVVIVFGFSFFFLVVAVLSVIAAWLFAISRPPTRPVGLPSA